MLFVDGSTCCLLSHKHLSFLPLDTTLGPFPPVNDGTAVLGFDNLPWWGVLLISVGLALVIAIVVWFVVCPRLKKKIECKYLSLVCVNFNHVNHKMYVIIRNRTMYPIQLHCVISWAQLFGITKNHVPVAQWLEYCVSSAKVVGSIPREHTYWQYKCICWMHCKSLWIKASAKC